MKHLVNHYFVGVTDQNVTLILDALRTLRNTLVSQLASKSKEESKFDMEWLAKLDTLIEEWGAFSVAVFEDKGKHF